MEFITKSIEKKCLELLNATNVHNHKLHDILCKIEFWEGGSVHLEGEVIVLSGDNGRHEFKNIEEETCFESKLETLLF